jgi:5-methylcytosine-specific restriction endonuclease McrA
MTIPVKGEMEGVPGRWIGERFIASNFGWQKLRKIVREQAENRCQECGIYTPFGSVHHRRLRKAGGGFRDDKPENLEYLCSRCHSRIHNQ